MLRGFIGGGFLGIRLSSFPSCRFCIVFWTIRVWMLVVVVDIVWLLVVVDISLDFVWTYTDMVVRVVVSSHKATFNHRGCCHHHCHFRPSCGGRRCQRTIVWFQIMWSDSFFARVWIQDFVSNHCSMRHLSLHMVGNLIVNPTRKVVVDGGGSAHGSVALSSRFYYESSL